MADFLRQRRVPPLVPRHLLLWLALIKRELTVTPSSLQCFYATAQGSAMIFLIFLGADRDELLSLALTQDSQPARPGLVQGWGLAPLMAVVCHHPGLLSWCWDRGDG
jgi:hypothetical protein